MLELYREILLTSQRTVWHYMTYPSQYVLAHTKKFPLIQKLFFALFARGARIEVARLNLNEK